MASRGLRDAANATMRSPTQATLCSTCTYRYNYAHNCLMDEQTTAESASGMLLITSCSGHVPCNGHVAQAHEAVR